jgi:uncharacterized membrane protein YqiK
MTWSVAVEDSPDAVAKFARRVEEGRDIEEWVREVVLPTLHGESRAIAANMGVEEVFRAREAFTAQVKTNVRPVLGEFGLVVLNASVTELSDSGYSRYFSALAETISAQAANKAVAVAAANRDGKIAAKAREGETRAQSAQVQR